MMRIYDELANSTDDPLSGKNIIANWISEINDMGMNEFIKVEYQ